MTKANETEVVKTITSNQAAAVKAIISKQAEAAQLIQQSKELAREVIKSAKTGDEIDAGEAGVFKVVNPVTDHHRNAGLVVGQWGPVGIIKS